MKHAIATSSADADKAAESATPPEAWTGFVMITPQMVQQILDANDLADLTQEQA